MLYERKRILGDLWRANNKTKQKKKKKKIAKTCSDWACVDN